MKNPIAQLEDLNKKQAELKKLHDSVKVDVQASKKQLDGLQAQAKKLYGTSDLEELKKMHAKMIADLQVQVAEYEKALATAQVELTAITKLLDA